MAGAGWQLLIALVAAQVGAGGWDAECPLPKLCKGLEGEGARLGGGFGEGGHSYSLLVGGGVLGSGRGPARGVGLHWTCPRVPV